MRSCTSGWRLRKAASESQCTVAAFPSNTPVSATSIPPEQAEQMVAPPACMVRIHATTPG
jgi:hypothetical protein